jgi:hypothetical protein
MKMSTRGRSWLVLAFLSLAVSASAQDSAAILRTRIPQCAVYSLSGSWIPKELYADGALRFTYLYEPPKKSPGEYDYRDETHNVYAAFWNRTRTKGELLQFVWLRRTAPIQLRIVNNGHIVSEHGKMDLEDALWGVWTHEHLMRRLALLKTAPLQTVSVGEIPIRGVICDSYVRAVGDFTPANQGKPR